MRNTQELKASDLRIAYIGGGSRGWAWGFMKDLAMDEQICGTLRLYDIDRAAAERNKIIGEKSVLIPMPFHAGAMKSVIPFSRC